MSKILKNKKKIITKPLGRLLLVFWCLCLFPIRPTLAETEDLVQTAYFFEELLKGTHASFLLPVAMENLVRNGVDTFVNNSKCRALWAPDEIQVKCFHHLVKGARPLDTAEKGALFFIKLLQLKNVRDNSTEEMRQLMAKELVDALQDPFSAYLSPQQVRRLKSYGQWGPGFSVDPKMPSKVHSIRPNSPADKAGIFVGDVVLRINSVIVKGKSFADVTAMLVGPSDERLIIEVSRVEGIRRFQMFRANEKEVALWAQKIEKDFLYIRPGRFDDGLSDNMWVQLTPHALVKGVILDLRHNPGGLLTEGVSFLNGFLGEGALGTVHPRQGHPTQTYHATRSQVMPDVPIVILVDGGTASVSEFVAMVLQERRKAVLIGQATLGKGRVQRIIPLPDAGSLKISVAELSGPTGKRIYESIPVDDFLAPAAGGTAISGLNPAEDNWVAHAVKLLRKNK